MLARIGLDSIGQVGGQRRLSVGREWASLVLLTCNPLARHDQLR